LSRSISPSQSRSKSNSFSISKSSSKSTSVSPSSIPPSLSNTASESTSNSISITGSISISSTTSNSLTSSISNSNSISNSESILILMDPEPSLSSSHSQSIQIEVSENGNQSQLSNTFSISTSSSRSKTPSKGAVVPILVGNGNGDTVAEIIPPVGISSGEFIIQIVNPPVFDETIRSDVISIELKSSIGQSTQLDDEIEICIRSDGNEEKDDLCLGFLNENKNPPEWECQDECLEDSTSQDYGNQESLFCGTSDHLTNFALLLGGSNSNPCGDSSQDYITGSYSGDLILVMCTIGAAIVFVCIIVGLGSIIAEKQRVSTKRTIVIDQTSLYK